MTKSKNIIFKILAIVMTFCMSFVFVGCLGFGYGDLDEEEIENMTDEELADWLEENSFAGMYGTKVLYKPSSYSYDENSRPLDELNTENNFYARYAYQILAYLQGVCNIYDSDYFLGSSNKNAITSLDRPEYSDLIYLYDSARYAVTEEKIYSYIDTNGNEANKTVLTADTSYAWKWSYDVNVSYGDNSETKKINAYINEGTGNIKTKTLDGYAENDVVINIKNYYENQIFRNNYKTTFVGQKIRDYDAYSQYSKALAYVIYRYALDLEPETISITPSTTQDTGINPDRQIVNITIGGKSVDTAFEEVMALFEKYGRIVGMKKDLIEKVKNWVLANVVGEKAQEKVAVKKTTYKQEKINGLPLFEDSSGNEYVQTRDVLGAIIYLDKDGNQANIDSSKLSPVFEKTDEVSILPEKDYNGMMEIIIENTNLNVSIGGIPNDEESNITIDNPYMASEMVEYAGPMFFVSDDNNFPRAKSSKASAITSIPAREYQSVTLMFKEQVNILTLAVALKYDVNCDGDGETDDVDQSSNDYIEITLELNYYNHASQKLTTYYSPKLRVYSGSYEFGSEEGWDGAIAQPDIPNTDSVTEHSAGYVFDGLELSVGAFNPSIGGNILKTDVGLAGYCGKPIVSKTPTIVTGHTRLKNWYEIHSGANRFDTGRLNHKMFASAGNEGCDYLEICYNIYKDPNAPIDKNYKFYTGISLLADD